MKAVRHCNRGFSLLEVMIALAIVSIALVTLLGLSNRTILIQERVQKLTRATLLAQQLMSEQELRPASQISWEEQEDVFEAPFEEFRWQISYQDTLISKVKQITVTVLWGAAEQNEKIELVSFVPQESSR